jgi:hypothetical protein
LEGQPSVRWFKHLALAHDDVGLSTLLEEMGSQAYGIYWLLLEHFAAVMEKDCTAVPVLVHSYLLWSKICWSSTRTFRNFANRAAELKLIESRPAAELKQNSSRLAADRLEICVPKLLKYRDEYSRKSGSDKDKLPARSDEIQNRSEVETEVVKPLAQKPLREWIQPDGKWTDADCKAFLRKIKWDAKSPTEEMALAVVDLDCVKLPDDEETPDTLAWLNARLTQFEVAWEKYWRKVGKKAARIAWLKKVRLTETLIDVERSLEAQNAVMLAKEAEHRPHMATWLNGERWRDEMPSGGEEGRSAWGLH